MIGSGLGRGGQDSQKATESRHLSESKHFLRILTPRASHMNGPKLGRWGSRFSASYWTSTRGTEFSEVQRTSTSAEIQRISQDPDPHMRSVSHGRYLLSAYDGQPRRPKPRGQYSQKATAPRHLSGPDCLLKIQTPPMRSVRPWTLSTHRI